MTYDGQDRDIHEGIRANRYVFGDTDSDNRPEEIQIKQECLACGQEFAVYDEEWLCPECWSKYGEE